MEYLEFLQAQAAAAEQFKRPENISSVPAFNPFVLFQLLLCLEASNGVLFRVPLSQRLPLYLLSTMWMKKLTTQVLRKVTSSW